LVGAAGYLCAGLSTLAIPRDLLGPDRAFLQPRLGAALRSTVGGLVSGIRHLGERQAAARALAAMTAMRFCYGALTVTVLMLCRYSWPGGLGLLGIAVGVSGAGFFLAAVITPWATGRFGTQGWMTVCAAFAAVLLPGLSLSFQPAPVIAAAFVLGVATQGAKIATDTVVQSSIDDTYRGRVFSLYDVLFNVAFVGAAGVAALMLPPDGRSVPLMLGVSVLYALTAVGLASAASSRGDWFRTAGRR
jgi:hypothetical protein